MTACLHHTLCVDVCHHLRSDYFYRIDGVRVQVLPTCHASSLYFGCESFLPLGQNGRRGRLIRGRAESQDMLLAGCSRRRNLALGRAGVVRSICRNHLRYQGGGTTTSVASRVRHCMLVADVAAGGDKEMMRWLWATNGATGSGEFS